MKNLLISSVALLALSSQAFAGGGSSGYPRGPYFTFWNLECESTSGAVTQALSNDIQYTDANGVASTFKLHSLFDEAQTPDLDISAKLTKANSDLRGFATLVFQVERPEVTIDIQKTEEHLEVATRLWPESVDLHVEAKAIIKDVFASTKTMTLGNDVRLVPTDLSAKAYCADTDAKVVARFVFSAQW